jgi:hypothetical protein
MTNDELWNEMTSECSSCTRSIGESFSSLNQSPFHTPDVNGCSAPASRAQANTCGGQGERADTADQQCDEEA